MYHTSSHGEKMKRHPSAAQSYREGQPQANRMQFSPCLYRKTVASVSGMTQQEDDDDSATE
jgi:hypothetical protein